MIRFVTADQRLADENRKDTIAVLGVYGIGKTSLVFHLPIPDTLFLNFEAGMKAVDSPHPLVSDRPWLGDHLNLDTFEDVLDVTCLIGGAKEGVGPNDYLGINHYNHVIQKYAGLDLRKYRRCFFDSISEMSTYGWDWAKKQPGAFNKKGVADTRGAYGELGRIGITVLKHLQRAPGIDMIFVGRLERVTDDQNHETWQPQMVGGAIGRELPGIVDHVITYTRFDVTPNGMMFNPDKGQKRAFVCQMNPWGLPAKTRSGQLDLLEEPHLGKLLAKINRPATQLHSQPA